MDTKHTYSLAQVEGMTGIPAEEVHSRIWRGELPGDGNMAMPGNRRAGTVNEATMEQLVGECRARRVAAIQPPPVTRSHFQAIPLDQAALELGVTKQVVEGLLYKGELEGPMLNQRYTGVTPGSLRTYIRRQEEASLMEAVEQVLVPAEVDDPGVYAQQGVRVDLLSLEGLKAILTGRNRT
nr:hypothetical protein [uncultured Holophaga sp.]